MIYRVHKPVFPLSEFIETFIYYSGVEFPHRVDRFLPNGDTEILIDFHDAPQFIYDNESLKEIQACRRVWASGVRTEPITIPSGNDSEMMVIIFKKGRAAPFFPFPMNEISDCVVDADLIWGDDFASVRERLLETADITRRFQITEAFLASAFGGRLRLDPCVSFAMQEMALRPDKLSIARMNHQIGYSQKHFADIFRRHVGITPKRYLKIMRFQKAIAEIEAARDPDWSALAFECGFYDQAHFIHDFKHFSGFTPDEYARMNRNFPNYVPVE